ncbi:MFS transporter, partial [Nocardioides massiliensis]
MTEISAASTHSLTAVLKYRDFRNLWIGLGLSSLGDWIGLLALTALANQQSGELAAVLGGADEYALANFAIAGVLLMRVLPALVMGPIAGWFADRLDRRTVLIWGDYVRAALFLSIPLVGSLWWVFVATVLIEMVSLVWGPAKDATVPNLVPRARLEAANQISLATTYGSALPAALLFTALTLSSQFYDYAFGWLAPDPVDFALLFNAVSFFVSGIVIARLRDIPRGPAGGETGESPLKVVVDGWKYVGGTPLVRGLVVGIIGAFAAGGVVIALARTFVADLGGGDPAYGVLFAAVFLGLGLGMWRGTRLLQGLSRRRLFGVALTTAGLLLFPLAALQSLEVVTA